MVDAESRPLTSEQVEYQLRKAGGTPFAVRNVEIDYDGGLFAPIGALNRLRRDFLSGAEAALAACARPGPVHMNSAKDRAARVLRRLQTRMTDQVVPRDHNPSHCLHRYSSPG
jgi:putative protease